MTPPASSEGEDDVTERQAARIGHTLTVSAERLADMQAEADAFGRWVNASPEQRAEWAREAAARREAVREAATPVPLTVEALIQRLDWSREYAEHVVQPYCNCRDGDGWETCLHADDLGVHPWTR